MRSVISCKLPVGRHVPRVGANGNAARLYRRPAECDRRGTCKPSLPGTGKIFADGAVSHLATPPKKEAGGKWSTPRPRRHPRLPAGAPPPAMLPGRAGGRNGPLHVPGDPAPAGVHVHPDPRPVAVTAGRAGLRDL